MLGMSVTLNLYLREFFHSSRVVDWKELAIEEMEKKMKRKGGSAPLGGRKREPAALGAGGREDSDLDMIMMTMMMIVRMFMLIVTIVMMVMMVTIVTMVMMVGLGDCDQGKSKLQ